MSRSFIIAILIILAVSAYVFLPRPARTTDGDGFSVITDIANFKTALNLFQVDCGRYPTTMEGLGALIKQPAIIPERGHWRGPYVDVVKLPKDRWGHDYVYRCPGVHNPKEFDIFSCGPDGIPDTADDIGNWITSENLK